MGNAVMKRVLLVVDSHKWCFGHMARGIQKYAPEGYHVDVLNGAEFCTAQKVDPDWHRKFDAICQFSWTEADYTVPIRNVVVVAHEGCMNPYPMPPDSGVLESLTTPLRNRKRADELLPRADHVLFFTEKMRQAFPTISGSVPMLAVDREVFTPQRGMKLRSKLFRVGWCAQRNVRHKGFEVMQSIMNFLNGKGFEFDILDLRATDDNVKTQQQMADWYRNLDAFVCTAASEGGPMTILEALACGIPVVSTPVGAACSSADYIYSGSETLSIRMICGLNDLKRAADVDYANNSRSAALRGYSWRSQSSLWLKEILGEPV